MIVRLLVVGLVPRQGGLFLYTIILFVVLLNQSWIWPPALCLLLLSVWANVFLPLSFASLILSIWFCLVLVKWKKTKKATTASTACLPLAFSCYLSSCKFICFSKQVIRGWLIHLIWKWSSHILIPLFTKAAFVVRGVSCPYFTSAVIL